MKENGNKELKIVIIYFAILNIFLLGSIIYQNNIISKYEKNKDITIKENKQVDVDKINSAKEKALSYLNSLSVCKTGLYLDSLEKNIFYFNDLPKEEIYFMLHNYLETNNLINYSSLNMVTKEKIKKSDLILALKEVFDKTEKELNINDLFINREYETDSDNVYSINIEPNNCTCKMGVPNFLLTNTLIDESNNLYLTYVEYYSDCNGLFFNSYSEVFSNLLDISKFTKYQYKFKLINNNYVFEYIEII